MMLLISRLRPPAPARVLALACAALLPAGLAACGGSSSSPAPASAPTKAINPNGPEVSPSGDIPDNQAYVAYSPPGSGYSVKIPEGWARTAAGGAVTFTDKLNSIRMEEQAAAAAPTPAQARSTLIPRLASTVASFRLGTVATVRRSAGSAVQITYVGSSPPDPVTGKSHTEAVERYIFFHRSRSVVLTLSAPKGADNVDPWRIVTNSLRFTG